jgi:translocation and assembly module TamB
MKQRVVAVLLLGLILLAGSAFWFSKSQTVMAGAQDMLSTQLADVLGSRVTVGQVEIASYRSVVIHNLTIYDKESKILAASENVLVSFSPWSILRGQSIVSAISEIKVEKPSLWLTQRTDGRWNVQDVFQQGKTSQASLTSKIILADGKATVSAPGITWALEEVNGSLDLAHQPRMDMELQAIHDGSAVKAKGTVNIQGRSTVTLKADKLMLAEYQSLCPAGVPIKLLGGSSKNIEATVAYDKGNLEYAGEAQLDMADIDIDNMPMRQVTGGITFTNKNIYVFATTKVFEQPLDVRGSIQTDASEPILNLKVSSDAFDPSSLGYNIPVTGALSFKSSITGSTSNPIIAGDFALGNGEIGGYQAKNAKMALQMIDKKITIHQFDADMLGGHIAASGEVEVAKNGYQLQLQGRHIDVKNLADRVPDISGYADADVTVRGAGSLADADIQGTVVIGQGEAAGIPFASLASGFYSHDGKITIDYFNVGLGQGMASARGMIDHQAIHLQVSGQGIPLALLGKQLGEKIDGVGGFDGEIRGTLSAPEVTANFKAVNGQILYQPFTEAKGAIHATHEQVALQDIEITNGVTKHAIQGIVNLSGQKEMNVTVRSSQARAETLINLLVPGEKLTGNVDNEMVISGPLANPNVIGKIKLTDGSFRGQLIAKGEGFYKREQGITTIRDFAIDSLNTKIKLSGSISASDELDFDVTADNIDMEKLNMKLPYAAVGKGKFIGKLTGTPNVPIFNGKFSSDKLSFNKQEVTGIEGIVAISGNQIDIPTIGFSQGEGRFNFAGGFDIATHEMSGNLDVVNAELKPILAVCKAGDKEINGRLNGHIKLDGTFDRPNIRLTGNLTSGKIKNYSLEYINIDVALENNIFSIYEFSARQGTGVLMAQGTADLRQNGPVSMEVGGRDIEAGLVAACFKTNIKPTGTLEFAAQITGTSDNPHTALSLELVNGGMGNATFDSLYGLLILDKDMIHVNQILLKKGPYRASAYGTIPVAALNQGGRQKGNLADQMDLKLRLDDADLSILPLLTKEVAWAAGKTQGEITISGSLDQPILTGNILVNNGILKFTALHDPVQKVGVDIAFEGDTINIKKFDGHMGDGSYSLTGTAKLKDMALTDYNISLLLDKPSIRSKYFTGAVNGKMALTQNGLKPKLSGKLLFENDIIDIPTVPEMANSDIDMDLDVEIRVGKKVRFYNPYLYDILAVGRVKLAGSTLEPDVSGRIVGLRGTVSYLRTEFKVNEASVDFKQFASFEPIVKLSAQTNLQQTLVNLNVSGPASAMQFKLTSEPSMSQQEILSLLTLRSHYFDKQNGGNTGFGKDEIVSALDAGLQMRFVSEVEGSFRNALGLDEFKLVRDTTSDIVKKSNSTKEETTTINREVYNLEMSKYLTDKLMLSYTMGVDHTKNELAFRYSINRRISLTGSIDDQNNTWIGAEMRYRF